MPPYDFPNNLSNLHITIIFKLKFKKKDLFLTTKVVSVSCSYHFLFYSFNFVSYFFGGWYNLLKVYIFENILFTA